MKDFPEFICRICGNTENNIEHLFPDFWDSNLPSYHYIECSVCGCLQIVSYPQDVQAIYPQDYYAHKSVYAPTTSSFRVWLRRQWIDFGLTKKNPLGFLMNLFKPIPQFYKVLGKHGIRNTSSVLDIGCGNGTFLLWLGKAGFNNLVGIDPYIAEDNALPDGTKLFRRFVFEDNGEYDFITLNHSFEHMQVPAKVLTKLNNLLRNDGLLMISIPILGYAWVSYGKYWWNLDAPRHFYLHTINSMQTLCNENGFKIVYIVYNSTYWQFVGSELLKRGITRKIIENENFNLGEFYEKAHINKLMERSQQMNLSMNGDQAIFFLKKKALCNMMIKES